MSEIQPKNRRSEIEAQLEAAIKGGKVGLWDWDLTTNSVYFSAEWKAQIGYRNDEFPNAYEEWEKRVHPDDLSLARKRIQAVLDQPDQPYEVEFRLRHKDGSYRWILSRGSAERNQEGQPVKMRGSHIDITEMRREREQHNRAQQVAHIGHWELSSPDGEPTWSDEVFRIFGIEPGSGEPSFTKHDNIIHPEEWPALDVAVRAGFSEGKPFDLVFRILRADGEIGWMHAIGTPRKDVDGRVRKMFGTAQDISALKNAEQELAKKERLLRIITDNMFDIVALTDMEGRFVYASPSHRQLGFEPDALIGEHLLHQVHEDDRDHIQRKLEGLRHASAGQTTRTQVKGIRADGQPVWLETMAKVIHDESAPNGMVVSSTRDITDWKKATEKLQASERRFRNLFENSLAPILIADQDGRYLDANAAACDMFGYDRDRLLTMKVSDLTTPMPQNAGEQFEEYKKNPAAHGEFAFIRADGDERIAMWSAAEISKGQFASVLRDVTDLKRTEGKLREARDRAQRYLDVAAVMLLGLDQEGKITLINPRGCEILGISSPKEIVGQSWFQFVPEDSRDEVQKIHRQNMQAKSTLKERVEGKILTVDGQERKILWHNAVLRDSRGNIVGSLSSGDDVTERRELEAQLAQNDRLSSVGMLAASVAHEINNPLSYVLYNLESLNSDLPALFRDIGTFQKRLSDPTYAHAIGEMTRDSFQKINPSVLDDILARLDYALSGTHRIRDVSRRLGTFSRVEGDQLVPVELTHVIEVAVNMAHNEVKHRARLIKDYARDLPSVMASEGRLSQVFLNLIINATHAIDEEQLEKNEIRIATWKEEDMVVAQVQDNGAGIPPENLSKIFEAFFTTKPIGVGSGLGLTISKNIIESFGGTIEVESEIGRGTGITVRLPVSATVKDTITASDESEEQTRIRGRVLIVDDEEGIRAAMAHMLRVHDTVQARSGSEARQLLERDTDFDLILCDMMMPDVSGMDLHLWLTKKHPHLARQFVFITGGAFTPRARDYLGKVDNLRLQKPFDVTNFKKIVDKSIERARQETTS